jgi:beta-carotene 3-hydroxylase
LLAGAERGYILSALFVSSRLDFYQIFMMMTIVWNIAVVVLAFVGMEIFSGFFHKYVMDGVLWRIHKTHHIKGKGYFEFNDLFSFSFGAIATALLFLGIREFDWRFWAGIGIIVYGAVYFVVHDIFIHRRIRWIEHSNIPYLQALRRAHKAHHAYTDKAPGEEYGLLWIGKKYWQKP